MIGELQYAGCPCEIIAWAKGDERLAMARPLTKTYSKTHPYVVERHDQENGSISYEIWDYRPDSYRRVCKTNDDCDYDVDEQVRPKNCAKSDAEMIARALNLNHGEFEHS